MAIEASGRREVPIMLANDAEGNRKLVKLATKRAKGASNGSALTGVE